MVVGSGVILLFMVSVFLGVLMAISSDSWFGAWCGLELNLMSFVPVICSVTNRYSSEAALKYFLVQALGSAFVVLGAILCNGVGEYVMMIVFALMLKSGAAPFHFWFPQVMEGLDWTQAAILMTVQKVAPMYLLASTTMSDSAYYLLYTSALLSAAVGAVGGINQVGLRKLMSFSSINHMSWMLFSVVMGEELWVMYFMFYLFISLSILGLFHYQQSFHVLQLYMLGKPMVGSISFMALLSMGGLPPFSGFIPKWMLVESMIKVGLWFPFVVLLMMSILTLYYYLRLSIAFFNFVQPGYKWGVKYMYGGYGFSVMLMVNFLGLFYPTIFIFL